MKTAYLGIDPGITGAAALWIEDNRVWFHDWTSSRAAFAMVKNWSNDFDLKLAALENPQAIPFAKGTHARKLLDRNFGQWHSILEINRIRTICPKPNQWKMMIPKFLHRDTKKRSIMFCLELFPGADRWINKIMHHNRAEALLLAEWARREDRVLSLSAAH
jgi:hypothetical protein